MKVMKSLYCLFGFLLCSIAWRIDQKHTQDIKWPIVIEAVVLVAIILAERNKLFIGD